MSLQEAHVEALDLPLQLLQPLHHQHQQQAQSQPHLHQHQECQLATQQHKVTTDGPQLATAQSQHHKLGHQHRLL